MSPDEKDLGRQSELMHIYKTVVTLTTESADDEGRLPDWSTTKSRYLNENIRHGKLRNRFAAMVTKSNSSAARQEEEQDSPFSVQSLQPMNLYAVKKQQKRIAALLSADKEAVDNHATNKQRRDLIKRRMNDITLISSSKQNKDSFVNHYLKDFYKKNDMSLSAKAEEEGIGDAIPNETGGAVLLTNTNHFGSGLPSMTISIGQRSMSKGRRVKKSNQKTILEQVERLHQLRRVSKVDTVSPDDKIYSLISRKSAKSQNKRSLEAAYFRTLPTKDLTLPIDAEGNHVKSAPPSTLPINAVSRTQAFAPMGQSLVYNNYVKDIDEILEEADGNLVNSPATQIESAQREEPTLDRKPSPLVETKGLSAADFRRLQTELRSRRELQPSRSLGQLGNETSRPAVGKENRLSFRLPESLSVQSSGRGARYALAARSSFLSGITSVSGPLPDIPSIDTSAEQSIKNSTAFSQTLSYTPTSTVNPSVLPLPERGSKSRLVDSVQSVVDTRRMRRHRIAGVLRTPSPRHSVSASRPNSVELVSSRDELCLCDAESRVPRVYNSCSFCYQTFHHAPWCENKDEVKHYLHCDTCGGIIRGLRTPPLLDGYDESLILITTPPDSDGEEEELGSTNQLSRTHLDENGNIRKSMTGQEFLAEESQLDGSLPNMPVMRMAEEEEWAEPEETEARSPDDSSSRKLSRVISPETMINHMENMISTAEDASNKNLTAPGDNSEPANENETSVGRVGEINTLPNLPPIIQSQDWTKIHKKAYIAALADARAKHLPLKADYLGLHITRSYTTTYFNKIPWNSLGFPVKQATNGTDTNIPEMKRILGNNNIYDYYPGGKKDHTKLIHTAQKIKATR